MGYGIEKTHADGCFEIAGVSRKVIEVFSTRRTETEAAVAERGADRTADDQRLAQRAALMTRAAKRDVDRAELRESWDREPRRRARALRRLGASRLAARAGGVEVCRVEDIELRAGDRIRWTRNDAGLDSETAEVAAVRDGRVTFLLEDGRTLDFAPETRSFATSTAPNSSPTTRRRSRSSSTPSPASGSPRSKRSSRSVRRAARRDWARAEARSPTAVRPYRTNGRRHQGWNRIVRR